MKLTEPPSAISGPEGERTYHCGTCGLTLGRDHNRAINLARRGQAPVLDVEGRYVPSSRNLLQRRTPMKRQLKRWLWSARRRYFGSELSPSAYLPHAIGSRVCRRRSVRKEHGPIVSSKKSMI